MKLLSLLKLIIQDIESNVNMVCYQTKKMKTAIFKVSLLFMAHIGLQRKQNVC